MHSRARVLVVTGWARISDAQISLMHREVPLRCGQLTGNSWARTVAVP